MTTKELRLKAQNLYWQLNDLGYYSALLLLGGLVLFGIVVIKSRTAAELYANPVLLGYAIFVTTFQLSRLVSAMFFKYSSTQVLSVLPREQLYARHEPTVTFVIPCKDEGRAIRQTITKCFAADYPPDKIEVVVINDGSTDDTIDVLRELEAEYPNLVVVDWKINRGKRHGMAEGFRRARGEIIVQLDSDSYIRPEDFRKLIEPFKNPEIGAVCAHADPENSDENWLTRMQAAYYFMSFRILKAAESTYGVVFCCSGCSSAYRKDIILPIADLWLGEKFLGLPVTWGDDRGLTNWVIKKGFKTIYTDEAKALTIVPTRFGQFIRQQIRWKKGWFVNSVFAARFIFKKEPFVAAAYFFPLTLVTLTTPFMASRALFYTTVAGASDSLFYYLTGIMLVTALIAVFYRLVGKENKYWPYLFVWSALNTFILTFLMFYSLATIQDRKWGTR